MENLVFRERLPGLKIDQVIRDEEFNMAARHMHSEYEIYYLIEGEVQYFLEGKSIHMKPGTMVFADREKIHKTSSVAGKPHSNRILLEVNPEWFAEFFKGIKDVTEESFFEQYRVLRVEEKKRKEIEGILFTIADEAKNRKVGCEQIVKSKLMELMVYALRSKQMKQNTVVQTSENAALRYPYNKVNEVAEYIQKHCHEKISLQSLADHFFVSKCYMSRKFKEATNYTINEYVTVQRLKKARKLLEKTDFNMTQVSEQTGFESVSYFEKVFKKHMGLTPLKYRKLRQAPLPQK